MRREMSIQSWREPVTNAEGNRQRNAIASVAGSVRAWAYEAVALAILNMQFEGTSPMKRAAICPIGKPYGGRP